MYTPFKMKGKSPMMKKLIGKQGNLPEHLKAKILAAPESPTKMMKKSPTKMAKKSPTKRLDAKSKKINPFSAEYKRMTPKQKREAREGNKLQGSGKDDITVANVRKSLGKVNERIQKGAKNLDKKIKGPGGSKGSKLEVKKDESGVSVKRVARTEARNKTTNNSSSSSSSSSNGFKGMKGGDPKYSYKKNSDGSYTGKNAETGKTFTIKEGQGGYDKLESSGLKMKKKSMAKMMKKSPTKMMKKSPAKKYKSAAQRKAVHASKADGGKGAPTKMMKKSATKMMKKSPTTLKKKVKKQQLRKLLLILRLVE